MDENQIYEEIQKERSEWQLSTILTRAQNHIPPLPDDGLDLIRDTRLSPSQMEQIYSGLVDGLSTEQVARYADKSISSLDMDLYRIGLGRGMDFDYIKENIVDRTQGMDYADKRRAFTEASKIWDEKAYISSNLAKKIEDEFDSNYKEKYKDEIETGLIYQKLLAEKSELYFDEIIMPKARNLPSGGLDLIRDTSLLPEQMEQILTGLTNGLSTEQVKLYAKPYISASDMDTYRLGLMWGMDIDYIREIVYKTQGLTYDSKLKFFNTAKEDNWMPREELGIQNGLNKGAYMDTKTSITDKVAELSKQLEKGVSELLTSEKYKNYLDTMAKFYNYSAKNSLLIYLQNPAATQVASFSHWQKAFERSVKKGEKGIRIFAPNEYKIKEVKLGADNLPVTDADGVPLTQEAKRIGFSVAYVFDAAQTAGKPLPEIATALTSKVRDFEKRFETVKSASPCNVRFANNKELEELPKGVKGYYDTSAKEIVLRPDMGEAQTLKTLIHEMAHAHMHDKDFGGEQGTARRTGEVQAESVAYVVCRHMGVDSSDYSFGYIAGWAGGKDTKELSKSLEEIQKTAKTIIGKIEKAADELYKTAPVKENFQETVQKAFEATRKNERPGETPPKSWTKPRTNNFGVYKQHQYTQTDFENLWANVVSKPNSDKGLSMNEWKNEISAARAGRPEAGAPRENSNKRNSNETDFQVVSSNL